ncbi:hypothetical protein ACFL04_02860 [Patescibacteria group bacterium]
MSEKPTNPEGGQAAGEFGEQAEQDRAFADLYEEIKAAGEIKGSQKTYSAEELQFLIENVRQGYGSIWTITNAEGIRDKVLNILGGAESLNIKGYYMEALRALDKKEGK